MKNGFPEGLIHDVYQDNTELKHFFEEGVGQSYVVFYLGYCKILIWFILFQLLYF